eukprot:TRINITY_DN1946_c0_g3_i1.p1 TRINITY_DN1946_c0_g3~~TRINITY_DN1946_c0_g3_i1.p1  ORF type:complete len:1523 (-),score=479.02 TRINITY_DN1946_c0_g3_i1:241-4809(-)
MENDHFKFQNIVLGEIQNCLLVMKINSPKWENSIHFVTNNTMTERKIMNQIRILKEKLQLDLEGGEGIKKQNINVLELFSPFLELIKYSQTTGPITSQALNTIEKFLNMGFVSPTNPDVADIMQIISDSVNQCKFENTDNSTDESVLMRIMRVLLTCLTCPAGEYIPDSTVLEIIQTCFRMSIEKRLSELLRKIAEQYLSEICIIAFKRSFSETEAIKKEKEKTNEKKLSKSISLDIHLIQQQELELDQNSLYTKPENSISFPKNFVNMQGVHFEVSPKEKVSGPANLLLFLVSMLDLESENNSDNTRLICLNTFNTIVEMLNVQISKSPELIQVIKDQVCKNLFDNLKTSNPIVFGSVLRVFFNLFIHFKAELKLQLELYFAKLLEWVLSENVLYTKQEIAIQSLLEFCKQPSFMVELYVNYDCELQYSDLFEMLCKVLYKNSFPIEGQIYTLQVCALEGLLAIAKSIALRLPKQKLSIEPIIKLGLKNKKNEKLELLEAVRIWNDDPKKGIVYLKEKNLVNTEDPIEYAKFLLNSPRISKAKVGDFVGKNADFNKQVLVAYINLFDLRQNDFLNLFREFLESFIIPGESPIIQRIFEFFAQQYYSANQGNEGFVFRSEDAVFLVCYATLILNVDLHSGKVTVPMKEHQFARQLQGQNLEQDFPAEFVKDIYYRVSTNEVKLREHYYDGLITISRWRNLITRHTKEKIEFHSNVSSNECDQEIFSILWGTLVAAISLVFETTKTKEIVAMAIEGFQLCAKIGAHFGLSQVVDNLVVSLCKFSKLNVSEKGNKALLSLSYEMKPQEATIALFQISTVYADHVREGWKNVVDCLLCLNRYELLDTLINLPSFLKLKKQTMSVSRQTNQSFFGSLWGGGKWFYSNTNEKQSQISEEITNAQISSKKILEKCNIGLFLEVTGFIDKDSLAFLIKTLRLLFEETTKNKIKTNIEEETNAKERDTLLCLDLLAKITLFNRGRIVFVWESVHQVFFNAITNKEYSETVCERATINLLLLCIELINTHSMVDQLLETIYKITQIYSNSSTATVCDTLSLALIRLLENNKEVLLNKVGWETCIYLFKLCINTDTASENAGRALAFIFGIPLEGMNNTNSLSLSNEGVITSSENPPKSISSPNLTESEFIGNDKLLIQLLVGEKFTQFLSILELFANAQCKPEVSTNAMKLIYKIFEIIPKLTQPSTLDLKNKELASLDDSGDVSWNIYWNKVFNVMTKLCKDKRPLVRNQAITLLQKVLLSDHLSHFSATVWEFCFTQVLFPFLNELVDLSSQNSGIESSGLEQTRFRAFNLVTKVFLQLLPSLIKLESFCKIWLQTLIYNRIYMNLGSKLLFEAVPETLKNILLVMFDFKILVPGNILAGKDVWELTWMSVGEFCPNLKSDLALTIDPVFGSNSLTQNNTPTNNTPTNNTNNNLQQTPIVENNLNKEGPLDDKQINLNNSSLKSPNSPVLSHPNLSGQDSPLSKSNSTPQFNQNNPNQDNQNQNPNTNNIPLNGNKIVQNLVSSEQVLN